MPGVARALYVREDRLLELASKALPAIDQRWDRRSLTPEEALRRQDLLVVCSQNEVEFRAATDPAAVRRSRIM
ncbi:hypothetical protein ACIA8K_29620 [Catenuloplanes sp. NPDC051500]|uniref:hypothetical protein n=1 Tax=Catenuloplanes sp. NPDC051500 TaxID=3363959 RepID=UPI0037B7E9BA